MPEQIQALLVQSPLISAPVIHRELRIQSRRPATYYARLVWGLGALAVIAFSSQNNRSFGKGDYVLSIIHAIFFGVILLLGPVSAADSFSRERREGTLGLLLLTPLTVGQIVREKFLSHFLRAGSATLLILPFLMLPILTGGVTLEQFLLSISILITMLIVGSSAAMMASAISIRLGLALILALLFAAMADYAVATFVGNFLFVTFPPTGRVGIDFWTRVALAGVGLFVIPTAILEFFQRIFALRHIPEILSGCLLGASTLFLLFSIRFCSWRLTRFAESMIETKRQAAFRRNFLTPIIFKKLFRRRMSRRLDRNPFAWLEYRPAWARASRTGALLILLGIEASLLVTHAPFDDRDLIGAQAPILFLLVTAITLKSSTSFHYEKENGAFELILVSPLTESNLVSARLHAVHRYFMPFSINVALIFILILTLNPIHSSFNENPSAFFNFTNLFLSIFSVPSTGLFFSLRTRNFFTSLFFTVAVAIVGAPLLWGSFRNLIWFLGYRLDLSLPYIIDNELQRVWWRLPPLALLYHIALICFTRRATVRLLQRRAFIIS